MRATPDAVLNPRPVRGHEAYNDYLPMPAHRKRAAIIAPSGAVLTGVCSSLIQDMVQRGHAVMAFAPGLTNKELALVARMGVEAYSLPPKFALLDNYRRMRELSTILADAYIDTALILSARGGAVSVAAAKIARIPKIVTVVPELGPAFMEGAGSLSWGHRQAMKAAYKAVFGWSDAIVFHSQHDRDYVQDRGLLGKSKVNFIAGGWGEDLRRNMQRPLPPLDKGILFMMATPLDRLQGVLEYCEAAKAIRAKSRRARFFLATTPGEAAMPLKVADLKRYKDCIQYIGAVPDAASVISRCHVTVGPSYGNGAPRSLYQALAIGRPVITTDTRSCRDFVLEQGRTGYCVPVRDAATLARAMALILQRPDQMPGMAEESRRLALRYCDAGSVNTLLLETLGL
jgi:glycosyltransferase involved in cell wall biosynthesis